MLFSLVRHFASPGTVAPQAPLSMGVLPLQYWSGLPCPPSGDLPNPERIEPVSPALRADSLPAEQPGKPCCLATFFKIFFWVHACALFIDRSILAKIFTVLQIFHLEIREEAEKRVWAAFTCSCLYCLLSESLNHFFVPACLFHSLDFPFLDHLLSGFYIIYL